MHGKSKAAGWLSAIQFLTILPIRATKPFNARSAVPFFPLTGLLIGSLLLLVDRTANLFWTQPVAALCDVLVLILISGALHLDGLADTSDGLYGHRSRDRALAIMKDSRIGAMGMVAVLCCLSVKWVGISYMEANRWLWLLMVPAYARGSVLIAMKRLPYGRPDGGTGHAFFENPIRLKDFWALALLALLSLSMGWDALKIYLGFAFIVGVTLAWYKRKIGVITGDMMGALIEVTEAILFLLAAAYWRG